MTKYIQGFFFFFASFLFHSLLRAYHFIFISAIIAVLDLFASMMKCSLFITYLNVSALLGYFTDFEHLTIGV